MGGPGPPGAHVVCGARDAVGGPGGGVRESTKVLTLSSARSQRALSATATSYFSRSGLMVCRGGSGVQ